VPSAADGTVITLRVVATTFAGKTNGVTGTLTIIGGTASTFTFASGGTINATDTQYENGTIIATGGTLTITGPHHFARLAVLNGATVVHPATSGTTVSPLDVTATSIYVACNSAIDASGRGYTFNTTYPGATLPANGTGGSHIGTGGLWDPPTASTFGSIYQPQEAGAGGENTTGLTGGGVIRIQATNIALDGSIKADAVSGDGTSRGGAGGSVWITTATMNGSGSVSAGGSHANYGSGGGGAIAIEYTSGTSVPWTLSAKTGTSNNGTTHVGGVGTIYLRGPQSVYGDLRLDNGSLVAQPTALPALGSGVALAGSSGATLVTDRTVNIPAYFAGNWVEISSAAGALKGTYRIASVTPASKTVTLAANGSDAPNVQTGDRWSGVYRFDNLSAPSSAIVSGDPIRLGVLADSVMTGPAIAGQTLDLRTPTTAAQLMTISGNVSAPSIAAASMHLSSGTTLSGGSPGTPLKIDVVNLLTVDSGAVIDVSGLGYPFNTTYPGATLPANGTGGSHIGTGGLWDPPAASTFGSIERPQESGGGGENNTGLSGGGAVHINAGSIALAGAIHADAVSADGTSRGGAGGSVWITAGSLSGAGAVSANGSHANYGSGGGGAIAIAYTSGSVPWTLTAKTGTSNNGTTKVGGAGSLYLSGPQATYGDLVIDNGGLTGQSTNLPSLGAGAAVAGTAGATLVTDRTVNIPAYFVSHWVEIRNAAGAVKGTWRIGSTDAVNAKKITLTPNASETIDLQVGDIWRGIYRFDHVTVTGATVSTADRLDSTNAPQLLNGATIVGNNQGAPLVVPAKITLSAGALAPQMTGSAGAVSDSDQPIVVFAQNATTGQSFSSLAAADGSFSISLRGTIGDSISVFARDGNLFPLQSQPVFIGTLPSSNATPVAIPITSTMTTDGNFHARRLAFDGNKLVAQNYPYLVDTNKVLVFDLSSGSPVWTQTITVPVNTRDITVKNNIAYVAGGSVYAYDLSVNPATQGQASVSCGDSYSVAADGAYLYAGSACGDGHIDIYDITNPKAPVRLRNQGTGISGTYRQLIPFGNYLIGINPDGGSGGSDVVMLDRRDINNLVKVWEAKIANFTGFRGSLQGTMLYVSGLEGWVAVIDVSVPTLGVVKSVYKIAGSAGNGIAAVGSLAFLTADTAGLFAVNATDPVNPVAAGGVATSPQAAWDVVIRGQLGIIAAEDRLITFTTAVQPQVNASKISMTFDGQAVTVQGAATAILGAAPLTAEVRDDTRSTKVSGVTVASDGSFTTTLAAASGDAISIVATDGSSVKSAVVPVGIVPFGAVVQVPTIGPAGNSNFRSRRIAIEGTTLAAVNYPLNTDTNQLLIYDISSATPVVSQTMNVPTNTRDVAIKNGVAYVAGAGVYAYDLSVNPATRQQAGVACGDSHSVAIDGVYAYTGTVCGDGHIDIYDITNPKLPIALRNQGTGISGTYRKLIPYGNYLIGITIDGGTDLVILDRSNINNVVKVSATSIPGIVGFRGAVSGQTLYLAGEGTNSAMAVVDLSNVAAPTFAVYPTSGGSRGVAVSGNLAAFGDGTSGVTFFDITNPASPRLIGTQNVGGMSWDVLFANGKLYAASEQLINVIDLTGAGGLFALTPSIESFRAPPLEPSALRVDRARISTDDGNGFITIRGSRGALAGPRPISIEIRNATLGTSVPVVPARDDGSFEASIGAAPADHLFLEIISGTGEQLEIDLAPPDAPKSSFDFRHAWRPPFATAGGGAK
jgi:hypothetical protein